MTFCRPVLNWEAWIEVRDFVFRWESSWNTQDSAGLLALVTDDVVWHDDAMPDPTVGRETVRAFLAHYMSRIPDDLRFETVTGPYALPEESKGALQWKATATLPDGPIVVHGADFYTFRGGLPCEVRVLFQHNERISRAIPAI